MNKPVLAYHVVFCTYGFWLPNDPRGSCSTEVRADNLQPFGDVVPVEGRASAAHVEHDVSLRIAAKQALTRPAVSLTGLQARSVGKGFANQTKKSGYTIHACSILPEHMHLVVARHSYKIEQVGRLLRQAATQALLDDNLHPFADQRSPSGRLPSIWEQDFWKVFLDTEEEIANAIVYVEQNPIKEGKPPQRWAFVTPFVFV